MNLSLETVEAPDWVSWNDVAAWIRGRASSLTRALSWDMKRLESGCVIVCDIPAWGWFLPNVCNSCYGLFPSRTHSEECHRSHTSLQAPTVWLSNAHPSPGGWALRARLDCVSGICGGWGRCRNAAYCLREEASRCNTAGLGHHLESRRIHRRVLGGRFEDVLPGISAVLPVGATPTGSALLSGALPLSLLLVLQEACVATPGSASFSRSDCTTTMKII